MREIKFRAYNKKTKTFTYFSINDMFTDKYGLFITENKNDFIIEQFTGLHDCDGTKIYEGDIVEIKDSDIIRTIIYKEYGFTMYSYDAENDCWYHSLFVKIIGNIHKI